MYLEDAKTRTAMDAYLKDGSAGHIMCKLGWWGSRGNSGKVRDFATS